MGELEFEQKGLVTAVRNALAEQGEQAADLRVNTPGGRFQIRWDEDGSATALGQLPFFAEFLEVSGLFERWVADCPMAYTSPNAPEVRDVLGTWLLSILDGQRRYAHVTGLRGDAVAPQILGMTKIVSDESLRRGLAHLAPTLKRCPEAQRAIREAQLGKSTDWMSRALAESTREALSTGWILDADTTIKLLYGHQDGAEISYNPTKPGRPSHVIHTYWIANLRLVLDAEVQNGKAHAARHSLPRLISLLKELSPEQRPQLVRADNAFGNEPVLAALEEIGQTYLSKLRQSPGVKSLIERLWSSDDWANVGGGYYAVETMLKLSGWSRARRVVVVRRAVKDPLAAEGKAAGKRAKRQKSLEFANPLPMKLWEYAVLVTEVHRVSGRREAIMVTDVDTLWELLTDWGNMDWWDNELERDGMKAGRTYLEGEPGKVPRTKVIERSNAENNGLPIKNKEVLIHEDAVAHRLYYTASDGFITGARNYIASWSLDPLPDGRCRMTITSNFDVMEPPGNGEVVADTLDKVYELILNGLNDYLAKRKA